MERRQIPGCDGYYADRNGHIWRRDSDDRFVEVRPVMHAVGYNYTNIHGKKRLTRRLVCAAFKGDPSGLPIICIGKAKRQRPCRLVSQRFLKWGSRMDLPRKSNPRKLSDIDRRDIVAAYLSGATQCKLAADFGVSQPTISYVVSGRARV